MKDELRPYKDRITADSKVLAGKPVVRGTRIAVDLVLEGLAQNPDIRELLAAHPDLVRAACRPAWPMPRRWQQGKR